MWLMEMFEYFFYVSKYFSYMVVLIEVLFIATLSWYLRLFARSTLHVIVVPYPHMLVYLTDNVDYWCWNLDWIVTVNLFVRRR